MLKSQNLKRYFQFALVVLAAGSIFPLIYLRTGYQETILEVFGMSISQLNTIYTILGIVFTVGYFPSGILADKFSAKRLLTVSVFMTGLAGLWFAQIPSHSNVLIIFTIWGIFSVFTFWAAHLKLVKLLCKKEEEGRFFGILDGGRGVVEAVLASVAILIFSNILGGRDDLETTRTALASVIYMYSIVLIVVAVLVGIFVSPDRSKAGSEPKEKPQKSTVGFADILKVFKNIPIMMLGFIIFAGYSLWWTYFYFGGFLQTNIGASAVTVGVVMLVCQWMRPVGGIISGFLADKFGKARIVALSTIVTSILLIVIATLPAGLGNGVFYALIVGTSLSLFFLRGTFWSLLGDCEVEEGVLGIAIGCVSFFGYLPDIILPIGINILIYDFNFGDTGFYTPYFIASSILGIASVFLIRKFYTMTKKG